MFLDEIASYWDRRADGYSDSIHEEMAGETGRQFRRRLCEALPVKENEINCLDIGCGPGFFSMLLASMGHCVTAVDYSREMLEFARQNCAEAGVTVRTVQADAQKLPFQDASFDFICSRNLVWNLENPRQAYEEWFRVLKPGGRFFLFDGNYYLYYYNDTYRKAREVAVSGKDMEHHIMKGVDPTPIDEIARSLPLSSKLRPDWDQAELEQIGFHIIEIERFFRTFCDQDSGEEKNIVNHFMLLAEKCVELARKEY